MNFLSQETYSLVFIKDLEGTNESTYNAQCLKLFSMYYHEYYGENFSNLSCLITQGPAVVARVLCYKIADELCLPNDGVKIEVYNKQINLKGLITFIMIYLNKCATENNCKKIKIQDFFFDNKMSFVGEKLFNERYHAQLTFDMRIDFKAFNEASYYKNLRKSYKSLINWGKKNLIITYINKKNLCWDTFKEFKRFHHKVAGRKTRSDKTWEIQYEMLKQGFGELVLAYYEDSLVAGSLFADFEGTSVYFTGVYERELFNFGLSHYVLYHGICRSQQRKQTSSFSLGYFDTDIINEKFYNIQFFKKGFTEQLFPTILWNNNLINEHTHE